MIYYGDKLFNIESGLNRDIELPPTQHFTLVFNVFVWMQVGPRLPSWIASLMRILQIFNEINSRKVHDEINVFKGMLKNRLFIIIFLSTAAAQTLVVEFGGEAFKTTGLTCIQWLACVVCIEFDLLWANLTVFVRASALLVSFGMSLCASFPTP